MRSQHHYRRRVIEPHQLDITTFLNLMIVLVPFLLVTAIFSRVTILELNLPAQSDTAPLKAKFSVEVIVRDSAIQLGDGSTIVSTFINTSSGYDLSGLTNALALVKEKFPAKTDATILLEPTVKYEHLVSVIDAVSSYTPKVEPVENTANITLFPDISIGDAP